MLSVHYDPRRPKTTSFFPPSYPNDESRMNKRRVFLSEKQGPDSLVASQVRSHSRRQEDNLDDSYYGMVQFKMGEIYVGMINVLARGG